MGKKYTLVKGTSKTKKIKQVGCAVCAVAMTFGIVLQYSQAVSADKYDDQINAIQKQVDEYNRKAGEYGQMAATLQGEVNKLNNEAAAIQANIDLTQAKYDKLTDQIEKTKQEIDETEDTLGYIIVDKAMSDKITPLERLASSSSITKYIDEETQRNSISDSLNDMIVRIEKLQNELKKQQKEVKQLLTEQKDQRANLQEKQNERQNLLDQTKGSEEAYLGMASSSNNRIKELRAKQAEEIRNAMNRPGAVGSVPPGQQGGGGYPAVWANAPLDAYVDNWGLYTRECVSYTAWKVWSTGRYMPYVGGAGNANQWPSTTAAYGIPHGGEPRAGSVAIWYIGYYGHAMYVERVYGNGTIDVSDYNLQWDGLYRYYNRSSAGLTYIYF
ncbi:MAG: CHAP domain-containing protein [Candidatus Nomurabacteria bacterium]|jgi:surface antigen|nr:CHAP domain-containing protein [Candidatus Nomurabacteria bacterium]